MSARTHCSLSLTHTTKEEKKQIIYFPLSHTQKKMSARTHPKKKKSISLTHIHINQKSILSFIQFKFNFFQITQKTILN